MRGLRLTALIGKEVIGVELVVPQKLIQCAVEVLRSGPVNNIDDRSPTAPVLGRQTVRLNIELLHGLRHRDIGRLVQVHHGLRRAIEEDLIGDPPASVRGELYA